MSKNRNSQNQQPQSNPWANASTGSNSSFIERATDWIVGVHSPKGLMTIGWGNLLASQVLNLGFWISVTCGVGAIKVLGDVLQGDFVSLAGLALGTAISLTSSFFQGYPIVQSRAASNILGEILATAFRPKLNNLPHGADPQRVAEYEGGTTAFNKMMKTCVKFATFLEIAVGIIFMGVVFGGGWGALVALLIFAYSIAGTQIGLSMVVQAQNVALPPAGRDAARKLQGKAKAAVFQAIK